MTKSEHKKLVGANALIWLTVALAMFILPLVLDSLAEGRSAFLKAMLHGGLMAAGIYLSTLTISKAVGPPSDAS